MAAPEAVLSPSLVVAFKCDADSPSLTCTILDGGLALSAAPGAFWLAESGPEGVAEGFVASLGIGVARAWNM
jgi:hypothetical protein